MKFDEHDLLVDNKKQYTGANCHVYDKNIGGIDKIIRIKHNYDTKEHYVGSLINHYNWLRYLSNLDFIAKNVDLFIDQHSEVIIYDKINGSNLAELIDQNKNDINTYKNGIYQLLNNLHNVPVVGDTKNFFDYKTVIFDTITESLLFCIDNDLISKADYDSLMELPSLILNEDQEKQVIVHFDFTLKNILIDNNKKMYLIDFDKSMIAPFYYEFYMFHKVFEDQLAQWILQEYANTFNYKYEDLYRLYNLLTSYYYASKLKFAKTILGESNFQEYKSLALKYKNL